MAQVTETLVRDELKRVEDGYMPMFTLWEFEQLLRGWLDMEALRKDAERYRFLRHGDNDERGAIQRPGPQTFLLRDGLLDICCDAGMADDADKAAHTVAAPAVGAA